MEEKCVDSYYHDLLNTCTLHNIHDNIISVSTSRICAAKDNKCQLLYDPRIFQSQRSYQNRKQIAEFINQPEWTVSKVQL